MRALRVSFPGTVPGYVCVKTRGQSLDMYACLGGGKLLQKVFGLSPGMYTCFVMDLLAECREHRVASQARSTALRVRFIVGDRKVTKVFCTKSTTSPPLFLHNACSVPRRNDLC
jgi:hypothetical protein